MAYSAKRAEAQAANRVRILAAAKRHFELHGYDAVTLRQIAVSADVTTGGIFASFENKEALFEAAVGRKVPMARVKDALVGAAERGEVPSWGAEGAAELLHDLYGSDA